MSTPVTQISFQNYIKISWKLNQGIKYLHKIFLINNNFYHIDNPDVK